MPPALRHALRRLWPLVGLGMLAFGLLLVQREIARIGWDAVGAALARVPPWRMALAAACAAGSYLCLTGFDALGLRWAGQPLPWRRAALASFVGLSIGHNVGLGGLGSGTLRWRVYSAWGLGLAQVARVVVFSGLTVGLGLGTLGAVVLLTRPDVLHVAPGPARLVAVALLAVVAAWAASRRLVGQHLRLGRLQLGTPSPRLAVAQIALGCANYLLEAAILWQILGAFGPPSYLTLLGVFVAATAAGLVSHAPGGLGVVEAVVLTLLPGADVIAALATYRLLYFWIPGVAGAGCLALFELRRRRPAARPAPAH